MLLSSTPQPIIRKHSFQHILNIQSPVKRNHSLLEYTRDNDTQVSELGPSGLSCFFISQTVQLDSFKIYHLLFMISN